MTTDASSSNPAQLLPHAGAMVLIDDIVNWDDSHIVCIADSHLGAGNPLRDQGRLSIYAGIEYAAQAMAAHARLGAHDEALPRKGFLAVASKLEARVETLDAIARPLRIEARPLVRNSGSSMYQFEISAQGHTLLTGQLTAVLDSEPEAVPGLKPEAPSKPTLNSKRDTP